MGVGLKFLGCLGNDERTFIETGNQHSTLVVGEAAGNANCGKMEVQPHVIVSSTETFLKRLSAIDQVQQPEKLKEL
ncbi:unnamed protein product [Angiostrongylus costaricensis]|uniref:Uncharacterized protein n=1 Tax=Angiostrongylus costaricensis TaxID=334426 RepID=A0A0R3PFD2_ANGCS|nr:unnamed protein product [Angiostrongylus costaricensis]